MVLFAMTTSIVDCLDQLGDDVSELQRDEEPSLASRAVGKPISHSQVLRLWKRLQTSKEPVALESLLFGVQIYTPPPPRKPEQSDEYKALMARLRREEDERAYERMINPPSKYEKFNDRFPSAAASYVAVNKPMTYADTGDDEVTLNEVHRQVMLILNFVASILGVAGTIWVVARWWSLPARIFLTLFGSIVVAIAEVGVYWAYVWKMDQGNTKEKTLKEKKEVIQTWVVGRDDEKEKDESVLVQEKTPDTTLRKRDINKGESAS